MKTFLDCIPCFTRQALEAARMVSDDENLHEEVLRRVLGMAAGMDMERTPPEMALEIHRLIRSLSGSADPYAEVKLRFNRMVLGMVDDLRARIDAAPDPFDTAVRLALAGNIIDFGTPGGVDPDKVLETVHASLTLPIHGTSPAGLQRAATAARSILYVGDNAGEIVFDRLLIERLGPERGTFVVRSGPIINDVTIEDARATGLADLVEVIDTGSDAPGALLARAGPAFRRALTTCDLVIAKGQGNYETLSDLDHPVFFLLRAKCPVIARHIGVPEGTMVVEGRNLPVS